MIARAEPNYAALDDVQVLNAWRADCEHADRVAQWPPDQRERAIRLARDGAPWVDASIKRLERERQRNGADVLAAAPATTSWPPPLDLAALATREPEAPRFIWPDWFPTGYSTLLAGHGGVGKSAIALHLAACVASGATFAGVPCEPRKVLYLSCEDREGILHWRLDRICRHMGISMAELAGRLDIVELVGHDSILWERDPRTGYCYTPAYGQLAERIKVTQIEVLMVDGISDTFAGNENARGEVKRYVNSLVALLPADTGAVVLIGHVAKPTAANAQTGEGYSGTTGWHNAVRARWYLYPETQRDDDSDRPERTGALLLELQKSNLGRMDQSITWRWNDEVHMFLPDAPAAHFDRTLQQREERLGILLALRACAQSGIAVPAATTGRRTAYHVLTAQAVCSNSLRSGKAGVRRFWREIETLRAMGHVRDDSIRRADRHYTTALVLTPEGLRACG